MKSCSKINDAFSVLGELFTEKEVEVFESNDYVYCVNNGAATVVGLTSEGRRKTFLDVPCVIDGYTVEGFGFDTLNDTSPNNHFTDLEDKKGIMAAEIISLPLSVNNVNLKTLYGVSSLKKILIPRTDMRRVVYTDVNPDFYCVVAPNRVYKDNEFNILGRLSFDIARSKEMSVAFYYNYKISDEKIAEQKAKIAADLTIMSEEEFLIKESETQEHYALINSLADAQISEVAGILVELGWIDSIEEADPEVIASIYEYAHSESFEKLIYTPEEYENYTSAVEACRENKLSQWMDKQLASPNNGLYACFDPEIGEAINAVEEPERDDYDFAGWFLDSECIERATPEDMIVTNAPSAFYAKWTEAESA